MSNPVFKTIFTIVLLSFWGAWGCASTETKPAPDEGSATAAVQTETPQAAVSEDAGEAAVSNETSVAAQPAEPPVAKEEAPAVEVIPAKTVDMAPIAVEPMPPAGEDRKQAVDDGAAPQTAVAMAPAETAKSAIAGPNQHAITVSKKDASHPAYGKGHAMGFNVDGVPGKSLVLERGKTYTFDVHTDQKHDVYLSSKEIGWGSAPIVDGVKGNYIYNGTMTFTPGKNTPDKVYYSCRNHPYMGGTFYVVNPGETVDIAAPAAAAAKGKAGAKESQISEAKVKQRLMFAEMMVKGQASKRVEASSNAEAKRLFAAAKANAAASREKLLSGDLPAALDLADKALKDVGVASRMVPSEDALAQHSRRYDELLHEVEDFEASHESNYARMAKIGSVPDEAKYDKKQVAELKAKAKSLAAKGDYADANAVLEQAQGMVTMAIHKMLDSQTLVYELKFDSPADEFQYELKRFTGYEELIPVAVEMKKPAAGALKLMDTFLQKARKRRDEAKQKAAENDYGTAIAMIQQATKTIRRALRMVGVSQ